MTRLRTWFSRGDESGFTILEVVMAMTIFAVMVPATMSVVAKTTSGVTDNRSRVVAASLVASQIEQVRTLTADNISASSTTRTIGSVTYTVAQTVTTASANGSTISCSTTASQVPVLYKLVTVKATWPNMGSIQPVRADTLVQATTAGKGALSVSVTNSSGGAVASLPVTLSNGQTGTTDANGCVIFTNITPGSYTATLNSAGYVGQNGLQSVTSPSATVTAQTITKISMTYDIAMSLAMNYVAADGSTALTSAELAEIPSEFRSGQVTSTNKTVSVSLPGSASNLYPAVYTVKSGTGNACTMATKDMTSGSPTSQSVNIPTRTVGLTNLTTFSAIGQIKAYYQSATVGSGVTCPTNTSVDIGSVFSIFGDHSAQLPLGEWKLQFPWNPVGFIPIPGLTVFCINVNLTLNSLVDILVDVGVIISSVIGGLLTGGGC
ncbi:hypothetical protein ACIB24_17620 [Spongisporangium articulatum]|uniref:alpha-amylase n=1 Tax=Spongisporangium articulatum TaxID=3362603 RepID=A0ABW8ARA4_9ACTN